MTVIYLADHSVWLALPAFAPALLIAGVVVGMVIRDRRAPDDAEEDDGPDETGLP
ncbi:hypothetical protein GOEFS_084_00080 [Gordonia effusa NBRC 100432]|uniref:Uncharacterized protein n=1 Tax=Gordonia effusa NBRC 100432 TaxID=1077974 RepID=H0R2X0_9ACTN|nr:hypothetical protein [Gordonia effusa]GAB19421.1 hypothetical protein GOEFS_084_00080 [Gordonia effusa NBRC 100432]